MSDIEIYKHPDPAGESMFALMRRLFPICRSLTGNGVRETLRIIRELIPLEIHEIPSGTQVFDWTIPEEWNIRDAWVKNERGEKVIDFQKCNLHLLNYSEPFKGKMPLSELQEHLYSLPDQPDLIPYITSYYKRRWGFCLTHKERQKLAEGQYEVFIDSTFENGHLTYADLIIPGQSEKEILLSTYVCHPSMANNELSGPVVAAYLAKTILESAPPHLTCRFVFIPETIGSIAYLSRHLKHLREKVIAGYVLTCVGDPGNFSYLLSREENSLADRAALHVLRQTEKEFSLYDFLDRGSDERQYCAPGVDLPVGSLMRTKYGQYPEYHTSGDNLDFVKAEALAGTLDKYLLCLATLEQNRTWCHTVLCEPQLGKRGLYPTLSTKKSGEEVKNMMNLLAYCDGRHDLIAIGDKINAPVWELAPIARRLAEHGLLI